MSMKTLNVVKGAKKTEILDEVMKELNRTFDRLQDTSSSVQIHRDVSPEENNFQNIKDAINTLLGIKIKKIRGKLDLIRTTQEVVLVPANEEEQLKIEVLTDQLRYGFRNRKLDLSSLDRMFSNKSDVQSVYAASLDYVKTEKMNLINNFVTGGYLTSIKGGSNPRYESVIRTRDGIENWFSKQFSSFGYGGYINSVLENRTKLLEQIIPAKVYRDFETDDELDINNLPSEIIAEHANRTLEQLRSINERFDAYVEEVSMPASEFFGLLSAETSRELEESVDREKAKRLRESECVRKTVNVDLTFNMDVELDTLGDVDDIKKVITQRVLEQFGSNVKLDFGSYFNSDIHRIGNEKFDGVEVVSELKEVA